MNTSYIKSTRILTILLALSLGLSLLSVVSPAAAATSALDFRNDMRKLWEDHITWTRMYIISAAADLPDKELVIQRLLQNQTDIGNAIKPYYGDETGTQLTALLKDHILIAADLITVAKAGAQAQVDAASQRWQANADDIATFLSKANPQSWPLDQMKAGMKMHLDLTLAEATARLKGNFAQDIADYDKVHEHILGLADLLSSGIIAQFPDKFDQSTLDQFPLHSQMRKLWEDHITWTRLYIVSAAADLPDKDQLTQRLLQNQVDIGNAIKPYYGDEAGTQLTALLKDHILIAADLVTAAKAGDQAKVDAANQKWQANADDIATFLSKANSQSWPLEQMKSGMKMHLDLTLAEATARLKGDFAADIADYDKVHEHILGLADTLSTGILSQSPAAKAPVLLPQTGAAADSSSRDSSAVWLVLPLGLVLIGLGQLLRKRTMVK